MGQSGYSQAHRSGRLHTPLGPDKLFIQHMTATEALSEGFTVVVEAVAERPVQLHPTLGEAFSAEFVGQAGIARWFHGRLWEYVEREKDEDGYHYRLILKPWTAFRSLNRNNRIFQKKSIKDIAQSVLGDEQIALKLQTTYPAIEYVVQYQESDFDFVSRLFEHEGVYHYFNHSASGHELVAIDNRQAHQPLDPASVKVWPRNAARDDTCLWSVTERRSVGPAKYVVDDYDFETPARSLKATKSAASVAGKSTDRWGSSGGGSSWGAKAEVYAFPAKYDAKNTPAGDRYGERWLEADRRQMARSMADGNLFAATVGRTISVAFPSEGTSAEFLIVATSHRYVAPAFRSGVESVEDLAVELELMPAGEQYRPAQRTPRPRVLGPQTAVVVGPAGEEIHTDRYGRIKVQFHWDREGKKDDKSSCWIRVAQWSAGKSWGSFMLPRIGQEVIVEFLDGDPDRPLVTGAVYNGDNSTPLPLPDRRTVQGIRTRSSKGGGGNNELLFEDKKDGEVLSIRAQKDLRTVVDKGNETRDLENGNRTTTIKKGNETLEISKGKRTTTIKGNDSLTIRVGDATIKVSTGKHKTEAQTSIELKCGLSSVKLDPSKITIKSANVEIKGQMMVKVDGLMVESTATAIQKVKGGLVLIN